jgi:hypothetical protein
MSCHAYSLLAEHAALRHGSRMKSAAGTLINIRKCSETFKTHFFRNAAGLSRRESKYFESHRRYARRLNPSSLLPCLDDLGQRFRLLDGERAARAQVNAVTGEHLPRCLHAVLAVYGVRDPEGDRRAGLRPEGALRALPELHHPAEIPDVHQEPADLDDLTGISVAALTACPTSNLALTSGPSSVSFATASVK